MSLSVAKTTMIGKARAVFPQPWLSHVDDAPVIGARPVWWLINGKWVHVGWLMPSVNGL